MTTTARSPFRGRPEGSRQSGFTQSGQEHRQGKTTMKLNFWQWIGLIVVLIGVALMIWKKYYGGG